MDRCFHITTRDAWVAAQAAGAYRPASLATEGFVHCSLPEQVVATANRFYRGQRDLVLLCIDASKLRAAVRFEPADGQLFPHVYGPIELDAVSAVVDFPPAPDGAFTALPPGAT